MCNNLKSKILKERLRKKKLLVFIIFEKFFISHQTILKITSCNDESPDLATLKSREFAKKN